MADDCIQLLFKKDYNDLIIVESSNWDGVAYIGARKNIQYIKKIEQLKNPGIYFLLGRKKSENTLYIGESENIANRFQAHLSDKNKDWFEKFIIFTSKMGDLNKAHVKYLEAAFIELAKENLAEIKLDNGAKSKSKQDKKIQTFDLAKAEGFQEKMIFVLSNLNLIDFATVKNLNNNKSCSFENIFYINLKKENKDKQAMLIKNGNGYILLKNSYLEHKPTNSFIKYKNTMQKRKELVNAGYIKDLENVAIVKKDIFFKSPSGAADIVKLNSTNGWTCWKTTDGITLDEFERK